MGKDSNISQKEVLKTEKFNLYCIMITYDFGENVGKCMISQLLCVSRL